MPPSSIKTRLGEAFWPNTLHVLTDIETLDDMPGGMVVSAAFCPFEPFGRLPSWQEVQQSGFSIAIDQDSALAAGQRRNQAQIDWFAQQEPAVREAILVDPWSGPAVPFTEAYDRIDAWFASLQTGKRQAVMLWGQPAKFDNTLLEDAYWRLGRKTPWGRRNSLCVSTLRRLMPPPLDGWPGDRIESGPHHVALADVHRQIADLLVILERMRPILLPDRQI